LSAFSQVVQQPTDTPPRGFVALALEAEEEIADSRRSVELGGVRADLSGQVVLVGIGSGAWGSHRGGAEIIVAERQHALKGDVPRLVGSTPREGQAEKREQGEAAEGTANRPRPARLGVEAVLMHSCEPGASEGALSPAKTTRRTAGRPAAG